MSEPINWRDLSIAQRNLLVAKKIMGWQSAKCNLDEIDKDLTIYDNGDACCPVCGAFGHINSLEHGIIQPKQYSTSMDAAWLIVEHITRPPTTIEEAERAANTRFMLWWESASVWAMNKQEACDSICVAALRAVGCEVLA